MAIGETMRRMIPLALWCWVLVAFGAYLMQFRGIVDGILRAAGLR